MNNYTIDINKGNILYKLILGATRANVLLYDHKANELFCRKRVRGADTIESIMKKII